MDTSAWIQHDADYESFGPSIAATPSAGGQAQLASVQAATALVHQQRVQAAEKLFGTDSADASPGLPRKAGPRRRGPFCARSGGTCGTVGADGASRSSRPTGSSTLRRRQRCRLSWRSAGAG